MTKQPDPNSKRSRKRKERDFTATRKAKRALRRLNDAELTFRAGSRLSKAGETPFTKPGKLKFW